METDGDGEKDVHAYLFIYLLNIWLPNLICN